MLRLVSSPGKITGGEIFWKGRDLLKLPDSEMRKIRGNEIAMIFQEPMTSLDPLYTIGNQIGEALALHQNLHGKAARAILWSGADRIGSLWCYSVRAARDTIVAENEETTERGHA